MSAGTFNAGLGRQACKDQLLDSTRFKLCIEVCSHKGIEGPMAAGDNVAILWAEWFIKVRTVFPFPKDMVLHGALHAQRDVLDVVETMLMQSMGRVDNLKAGGSCSGQEPDHIGYEAHLLELILNPAIDLAVLRKKVIQDIYQNEGGNVSGISRGCHGNSFAFGGNMLRGNRGAARCA